METSPFCTTTHASVGWGAGGHCAYIERNDTTSKAATGSVCMARVNVTRLSIIER
jgi:hypothetical protein